MSTDRLPQANALNAIRCTGPRPDEDKPPAREDAHEHGFAGKGIILCAEDQSLLNDRREAWRADYVLNTDHLAWTFERLVLVSVRLDRCVRSQMALRTFQAERAAACWDDDRRLEAEELGARLSKRPALVVQQLSGTKQGCEWLIRRWGVLGAFPADGPGWDEAQTSLALDMLGAPLELRSHLEFSPGETPAMIAGREVALLEKRLAGLIELDDHARRLAESGQDLTPSREMLRLQRYEAACLREYYKLRAQLISATTSATAPAATPAPTMVASVPAPPPAPEPPPPPLPLPPLPRLPRATEEDYRAMTVDHLTKLFSASGEPALGDEWQGEPGPTINSLDEFIAAMTRSGRTDHPGPRASRRQSRHTRCSAKARRRGR